MNADALLTSSQVRYRIRTLGSRCSLQFCSSQKSAFLPASSCSGFAGIRFGKTLLIRTLRGFSRYLGLRLQL